MSVFSGSYHADEVEFLLTPTTIEDTPIELKEHLIQTGQKHYSELLTLETLPAPEYITLFHNAMTLNQDQVAEHLLSLAKQIVTTRPSGITLVSLARAGTPIGVLLKHILRIYFNINVPHYSISILRDVGLDTIALDYILQRHTPESLVFVDGWTGKGIIVEQLADSLAEFKAVSGVEIPAELYVLADLCGKAKVAATTEDYLIPSCILNSTISGLVSRSINNKSKANANDFHGCVYYEQYREHDLSGYFIETILERVAELWPDFTYLEQSINTNSSAQMARSEQFITDLMDKYTVSHKNYIKPGIGESTRVLLRREARLLILKDFESAATQHLRWLAESKVIPIQVINDMPYQAIALIKEIKP